VVKRLVAGLTLVVASVLVAAPPAMAANELGLVFPPVQGVSPSSGVAVISGDVHCQETATVLVTVQLSQTLGGTTTTGTGQSILVCEGIAPFSMRISPETGRFHPGTGTLEVSAVCIGQECVGAFGGPFTTKLRPTVP
jgi:hypothetical protein